VTVEDAWSILRAMQSALESRDRDALAALFHDDAVLIGTSADARDRDAVLAYLTAVAEGEPFRWEYTNVVPFHDDGFAAFGEIVAGDQRLPFRMTLVFVDGKIRNFHGSIPYGT
jgi:ketosteroid isomerase-like protein